MVVCLCVGAGQGVSRQRRIRKKKRGQIRGQKTGSEAERGETMMYWLTIFRKVDISDKLELPNR